MAIDGRGVPQLSADADHGRRLLVMGMPKVEPGEPVRGCDCVLWLWCATTVHDQEIRHDAE
jgi:hypothetical protein